MGWVETSVFVVVVFFVEKAQFYLFVPLLSSADFFKIIFSKSYFRNIIRVSNGLDSDQEWVQTVCKGYQQTTDGES